MKNLIFLLASTVAYNYSASAKKSRKFLTSKTEIPDFIFSNPGFINTAQSENGDIMHMGECNENDVTYGLIRIQPKDNFENINDAATVLTSFMHRLQPAMNIKHSFGLGSIDAGSQNTSCFADYWQDKDMIDWKVKGWTDGYALTVLYIRNIGNAKVEKEEIFFNEFKIPVKNFAE